MEEWGAVCVEVMTMNFTSDLIDNLIACPKRVVDAPSREFKEENRHRRKDMRLHTADDEARQFNVFIRQSLEFSEDFSLGLIYLSAEGKRITLIRYNGQHEQSNDSLQQMGTHFQYHIHRATSDNLSNGRLDKHPANSTDSYGSFEEAVSKFLSAIGLTSNDIAKHFPSIGTLPLFHETQGSA